MEALTLIVLVILVVLVVFCLTLIGLVAVIYRESEIAKLVVDHLGSVAKRAVSGLIDSDS